MEVKKNLTQLIKNSKGNYYKLKLNPLVEDISAEDFIPNNLNYPDAERYNIYSYDEESKSYSTKLDGKIEDEQIAIKKLKDVYGIQDPWDNDTDYFKKKLEKQKISLDRKAEKNLRDENGNYFQLKIKQKYKNTKIENFIPDYPEYPDACRYDIKNDKSFKIFKIKNIKLKDIVVKKLKKIHNITDPWDNNANYKINWKEQIKEQIIKEAFENCKD